jgi:EpsI family protein
MNTRMFANRLPDISLRLSMVLCAAMMMAAIFAYWATPHLVEVTDAPSLEDTVPRQFGDWRELPTPYAQVSLSTGLDPNMEQPYDQVVMRTYVNSKGEQVMLALAWGKRQRQEVKIHRPDLCYIAQGYEIASLAPNTFNSIVSSGQLVSGKHMVAMSRRGGEAVSYWMRIGSLFSESAVETRIQIAKAGLNGRIPDGILVRSSVRIGKADDAARAWPLLDKFLLDLVTSVPDETRTLLLGSREFAGSKHEN